MSKQMRRWVLLKIVYKGPNPAKLEQWGLAVSTGFVAHSPTILG